MSVRKLSMTENTYEQCHDKINRMACTPSEDSDQPGHPPSLIRVFAVRIKKAWVLSYPSGAQQRLWSDWANAQAGLSLHWAHRSFCWFCHEEAHIMLAIIMIHGERRLLLLPDTVAVYCMSNNSFLWWMLCEVFYLQTQNCFHLAPQTPPPTEWNTIKKGISV